MRTARYWILFAICSVGWLTISLLVAPLTGGLDVMYFREPGWNLVSIGAFDSSGLVLSHGLAPVLFSHYTPIMPLLFAGYLSLFPRNAYAGTIFNLLLGMMGAGCALYWVMRNANSARIGKYVAVAIAVFPIAFIFYDRPEIVGYPLACVTMAYAARAKSHPIVAGLMIGITFMAHPVAAVFASLWVTAFFFIRNWEKPKRWMRSVRETGWAAAAAALVIGAVATFYYSLDPSSISRFFENAALLPNALGMVMDLKARQYLDIPIVQELTTPGLPLLFGFGKLFPPIVISMLIVWVLLRRKQFHHAEWILFAASFLCIAFIAVRFPAEGMYPMLLSLLIPTGFLIADQWTHKLSAAGLTLLLVAVLTINLPDYGISLLFRFEQRSSYLAAKQQPSYLRSQIPSPNSIVALVPGPGAYDIYKPEIPRLIGTLNLTDGQLTADVMGVVNCYNGFTGGPGVVRPFPDKLNAAEFHMIQPAPTHLWITVFGHRISNTQRGFGCDLYRRNTAAPNGGSSHS